MINVSNSGSGPVEIYPEISGLFLCGTLFLFDINIEKIEAIKNFYKTKDVRVTNILQLERYSRDPAFEDGLRAFIKYGIFENQSLCEMSYILTTTKAQTEIVKKVVEEEQRAITKFRGRKWPTEDFYKEFLPFSGSGAVSPPKEEIDMTDVVAWIFDIGYSEEMTTQEYSFDPENPEDIPIPLDWDVEMPPIPDPPSESGSGGDSGDSAGSTVTYSIIYYYWNEYTTLPFIENHARPMGNLVSSNEFPVNTISVHVYKQKRVEIVVNVTESSGGGD